MLEKTLTIENLEKPNTSRVLSGYKEIAGYLGVSTRTLQRHLNSIPVSRFGKTILILESELMDWVRKSSNSILED